MIEYQIKDQFNTGRAHFLGYTEELYQTIIESRMARRW